MSLLQLDLPADQIEDRPTRRALDQRRLRAHAHRRRPRPAAREERPPRRRRRSAGSCWSKARRRASATQLGIPPEWAGRCEDSRHLGHDDTADALGERLERHLGTGTFRNFDDKISQLGSYGGGNHFGECEVVHVEDNDRARAGRRGLRPARRPGRVPLALRLARLRPQPGDGAVPRPAGEVRPLGHPAARATTRSWSTPRSARPRPTPTSTTWRSARTSRRVNHLLINALVLEAFQEVFPGVQGRARLLHQPQHRPQGDRRQRAGLGPSQGRDAGLSRPATTRSKGTLYAATGHPILLPGNPQAGSSVMVADAGAA